MDSTLTHLLVDGKLSEPKPPLNPRMIYNKRYDLVLAIFEWTVSVSVLLFFVKFINNLFFKQMNSGIIQKSHDFCCNSCSNSR